MSEHKTITDPAIRRRNRGRYEYAKTLPPNNERLAYQANSVVAIHDPKTGAFVKNVATKGVSLFLGRNKAKRDRKSAQKDTP